MKKLNHEPNRAFKHELDSTVMIQFPKAIQFSKDKPEFMHLCELVRNLEINHNPVMGSIILNNYRLYYGKEMLIDAWYLIKGERLVL